MADIKIYGELVSDTTDGIIAYADQLKDKDVKITDENGTFQSVINQQVLDDITDIQSKYVKKSGDTMTGDLTFANGNGVVISGQGTNLVTANGGTTQLKRINNEAISGGTSNIDLMKDLSIAQDTNATNATQVTFDYTLSKTSSSTKSFTISGATHSKAGVMSAADKTKLDNLNDTEANETINTVNSLPNTIVSSISAVGANATTVTLTASTVTKEGDGDYGSASESTKTIPNATTTTAGVMTAADKIKLNGIESGATVDDHTVIQQASASTNSEYPLILSNTTSMSQETAAVRKAGGLTYNPSSKTLTTTTFKGNLNGNASTADNADYATNAGHATNADNATTADSAKNVPWTGVTNAPQFISGITTSGTGNVVTGITNQDNVLRIEKGNIESPDMPDDYVTTGSLDIARPGGNLRLTLRKKDGTTTASTVSVLNGMSLNGSGNVITGASVTEGTLILNKGTIEPGEGADGNNYPTNITLNGNRSGNNYNLYATIDLNDASPLTSNTITIPIGAGSGSTGTTGSYLPLGGGTMETNAVIRFNGGATEISRNTMETSSLTVSSAATANLFYCNNNNKKSAVNAGNVQVLNSDSTNMVALTDELIQIHRGSKQYVDISYNNSVFNQRIQLTSGQGNLDNGIDFRASSGITLYGNARSIKADGMGSSMIFCADGSIKQLATVNGQSLLGRSNITINSSGTTPSDPFPLNVFAGTQNVTDRTTNMCYGGDCAISVGDDYENRVRFKLFPSTGTNCSLGVCTDSTGPYINLQLFDASTSLSGLMSAADKKKLDGLSSTGGAYLPLSGGTVTGTVAWNKGSGNKSAIVPGVIQVLNQTSTDYVALTPQTIQIYDNGNQLVDISTGNAVFNNSIQVTRGYNNMTSGIDISTTSGIVIHNSAHGVRFASGGLPTKVWTTNGGNASLKTIDGTSLFGEGNIDINGKYVAKSGDTMTGRLTVNNSTGLFVNGQVSIGKQDGSPRFDQALYVNGAAVIGIDGVPGNTSLYLSGGISHNSLTPKFDISADGVATFSSNVTAQAFYEASDIKLKENVSSVSNDIEKADKVKIKEFNFKSDETKTKKYGVIAQELEEVGLENLVNVNSDGDKTVDYIAFLCLKIAALEKELKDLKEKK